MQFSGQRTDATVPLDAGSAAYSSFFDGGAAGSSGSTWTVFHPFRKLARALLRSMSGSVGVVVGLINAWRQAMAAHPVKTMVISFVVAAGISVMLMAMWLVVLALIRARAESFHLPISAVARIVPDGM